uniref:N-acetyltransferase domain-containing protein n=1 Tax=Heliothis virescens TaxID=7102 RepID=A0A2A4JJB4_HELVI
MQKSFFQLEPLCQAFGVLDEPGAAEELLQTCYDAAKDGVSIVARHTDSNEIVGVVFNKIQVLGSEEFNKNFKHKSVKLFYDFAVELESRADLFNRYNTKCIMEELYMATMPDFQKRKIGELLCYSAYKLGQELYKGHYFKTPLDGQDSEITNAKDIPTHLVALTTSYYTQRLADKLGYDNVLEVDYKDYQIEGINICERIGDKHKTCRIIAKKLDIT